MDHTNIRAKLWIVLEAIHQLLQELKEDEEREQAKLKQEKV